MPGSGEGEEAPVIFSCFQGSACPLPSPLPSLESAFSLSTFPAPPSSPAHLSSLRNLGGGENGCLTRVCNPESRERGSGSSVPSRHSKGLQTPLASQSGQAAVVFTSGEKSLWYQFTIFLSSPLLLSSFPFDRHLLCSFQF